MSALKDNGDFRERPHQPTRYELIDKDGNVVAQPTPDGAERPLTFDAATAAAAYARSLWPDQEQDEERTGKGWDIQTVEAGR